MSVKKLITAPGAVSLVVDHEILKLVHCPECKRYGFLMKNRMHGRVRKFKCWAEGGYNMETQGSSLAEAVEDALEDIGRQSTSLIPKK